MDLAPFARMEKLAFAVVAVALGTSSVLQLVLNSLRTVVESG
jgi:hypothetical protein